MQSKQLERFYDEHCSRTITKIADCEKRLAGLKAHLREMDAQAENLQRQLHLLWAETLGMALLQREIYRLKREEALILSRLQNLQLSVEEMLDQVEKIIIERDDFIRLRVHYEKKKNKWEWMSCRARKMRIRKDIHRDEQAAEECVTWVIQ